MAELTGRAAACGDGEGRPGDALAVGGVHAAVGGVGPAPGGVNGAASVAAPAAGGTVPAGRGAGRIRLRRPLKTLLAEGPVALPHASGGRDRWSAPLRKAPEDGDAALRAALDEVLDPELPISVMELGLVYGVAFEHGTARVDLTFTATACPCMDFIKQDVRDRIAMEPWVESVEINEVWDPPWTTARISEAGRSKLRALGVGA